MPWDSVYFLFFASYPLSVWYWLLVLRDRPLRSVPPPPLPSWIAPRLAGTAGGTIGGWLANRAFGVPAPEPAFGRAAAMVVGIAIGVTIAIDLYQFVAVRLASSRQIGAGRKAG
jgi:hypothetical protein